jgi:hypothetical protein
MANNTPKNISLFSYLKISAMIKIKEITIAHFDINLKIVA